MNQDATAAITAALRDHGPATGPQLATLLDVHPAMVERYCRRLQEQNRVRLVIGGRYALADDGGVSPDVAAD
jgi:Mn-dependent DtxR family transcriptional regulator